MGVPGTRRILTAVTGRISKHLKGQLDPPVGNGNVFCIKGGQLDPPVGNGNIFCIKGGQLDPPGGLSV